MCLISMLALVTDCVKLYPTVAGCIRADRMTYLRRTECLHHAKWLHHRGQLCYYEPTRTMQDLHSSYRLISQFPPQLSSSLKLPAINHTWFSDTALRSRKELLPTYTDTRRLQMGWRDNTQKKASTTTLKAAMVNIFITTMDQMTEYCESCPS